MDEADILRAVLAVQPDERIEKVWSVIDKAAIESQL
jgi:predicted ester cyclase